MLKKNLLLLFIILSSLSLKAQEVSPTDLIQMFKLWRSDEQNFDRNTNDYLVLLDKKWVMPSAPLKEKEGDVYSWFYYPGDRPMSTEYAVIGGVNATAPSRTLIYNFKGVNLWRKYQKQMELLNAKKFRTGPVGDGTGTNYFTNSMAFLLVENPPGINSDVTTYSVEITTR